MSGLFKAYKTDATAEANGIPIKFHDAENEDGTVPTFFVAYMGSKANTRYAAAIEKARKPFQTLIDAGNQEADPEQRRRFGPRAAQDEGVGERGERLENDQLPGERRRQALARFVPAQGTEP